MQTNWECFSWRTRLHVAQNTMLNPALRLKNKQMVQHADSESYRIGNEGSELDWGRFIGSRRSSRSLTDLVHHQHHISTKLNHKNNCLDHSLTDYQSFQLEFGPCDLKYKGYLFEHSQHPT